jgi:hypothetical protein
LNSRAGSDNLRAVFKRSSKYGLVLVALVAAGSVTVGCKKKHGATTAAATAAPAELKAEEGKFDFGKAVEGDKLEHTFVLANAGAVPLKILRTQTSCGCTTAQPSSDVVAPGAKIDIKVVFDTLGRVGKNRKFIDITTDSSKTERVRLEISAEIEPLFSFEPRFVRLAPKYGEEAKQEVKLVGKRVAEAKPKIVETVGEGVTAELIQSGDAQVLRLVASGKKIGVGSGRVVIDTGLDRPNRAVLRFAWDVRGNIEVVPAYPYFDPSRADLSVRLLRVRSSKEGFKLTSVKVLEGPFKASIEAPSVDPKKDAATVHPALAGVSIKVELDKSKGEPKDGKLLLVSNDPIEPKREIILRVAPPGRPGQVPPPGMPGMGGMPMPPNMPGAARPNLERPAGPRAPGSEKEE